MGNKTAKLLIVLLLVCLPSQAFGALLYDASGEFTDHGRGATTDDLTTLTVLVWFYPTSLAETEGVIISKFRGLANEGWQFYKRTDGNLSFAFARVPSYMTYTTDTAPLSIGTWEFAAAVADQAASPVAKIYHGDLGAIAAEQTYGTAADGSGTFGLDNARQLYVGNRDAGGGNAALGGRVAIAAVFNRVLTLAEIQSWQFQPRALSGCVLFVAEGFNGVGTQADWSGTGNNGTVTNATVANHVPLPAPFAGAVEEDSIVAKASLPQRIMIAFKNLLVRFKEIFA